MPSGILIIALMTLFVILCIVAKKCYDIFVYYRIMKELDLYLDQVALNSQLIAEGRGAEADLSEESYEHFLELMDRYIVQCKKLKFGVQ